MVRCLVAMALLWFSNAVVADEIAESCKACHKDNLTLGTWQQTELVKKLTEIRDGRAGHPVPIPSLSDERLAEIAAALAAD